MIFGLNLLPAFALMLAPGVAQSGPVCSATTLDLNLPVQARPAACGLYCDTSTEYVVGLMAGSGSSCAAALSDLTAQITAYANQHCRSLPFTGYPSCNVIVNHSPACTTNGPGLYSQIGWGYYYCQDTTC
jgi:hypothetical protein